MPHELHHDGYLISDDPARLDIDAVHAFLTHSYWAAGIPRETVARALAHSLCLGTYALAGVPVEDPSKPFRTHHSRPRAIASARA